MQVIDKDHVVLSIAHGDFMLFKLVNGTYQFGTGAEAKVVRSLEEVKEFPAFVQENVKRWLENGGVQAAQQDKRARLIAENARREGAGMLDELVAAVGGDALKGELMEVLTAYLKAKGTIAEQPPVTAQKLDHGSLVVHEDGTKEFIPNDAEMDEEARKELEAAEREADELDREGEEATAAGDMSEEVNTQKRPKRKR